MWGGSSRHGSMDYLWNGRSEVPEGSRQYFCSKRRLLPTMHGGVPYGVSCARDGTLGKDIRYPVVDGMFVRVSVWVWCEVLNVQHKLLVDLGSGFDRDKRVSQCQTE